MEKVIKELNQVNWNFFDYYSTRYPLEISSLSWYFATYPAPLAKFLIGLLSKEGDIVLDPFGGSGTTCYEAIKLNRKFIYNDINPFTSEMVTELIEALSLKLDDDKKMQDIILNDRNKLIKKLDFIDSADYFAADIDKYKEYLPESELQKRNISLDSYYWYHVKTLKEMLDIFDLIEASKDNRSKMLRKFAFTNKLKDMSSQKKHYTYITDNCKPKLLKYNNAYTLYLDMLERVILSLTELCNNYSVISTNNLLSQLIKNSIIHTGDARSMDWIREESIDFVLTSPPYICSQDYIKTMRLFNLFYYKGELKDLSKNEIGPRVKRKKKPADVIGEFYQDMELVIREIYRVLRREHYFCMVVGQGKNRITDGRNTIVDLCNSIQEKNRFELKYETVRNIEHKSQRIGGVDKETIFIFQKK